MNSFWSNIYDDCKDRRYGTLFFITLLIVCGLVSLALAIRLCLGSDQLHEVGLALLPGLALVLAALVWRWIRYGRKRRQERLKYAFLSRDELAKARSKLKSQMKPMKSKTPARPGRRPAPRPPDTNIKY
jgi:hypothetical protein